MGKKKRKKVEHHKSIVPGPSVNPNEFTINHIRRESENSNRTLQEIPDNIRGQLVAELVSVEKHHHGPLPEPKDLEHYDSVIPNGANRIMAMAERQQEHRLRLENEVVAKQLKQSSIGQIFAFIVAMTTILAGVYCIVQDYELSGTILSGLGLTGIVTAFIRGKSAQRKDLSGN